MSTKALRDHNINVVLGSDKKIDGKGNLTKSFTEKITENGSELQKNTSPIFSTPSFNGDVVGSNGSETGNSEVEYIESENLVDLPDLDLCYNVCSHPQSFLVSFPMY